MRKDKRQAILATAESIDAKFAEIQRLIVSIDFLDDKAKADMITLCMGCNDRIVRAII